MNNDQWLVFWAAFGGAVAAGFFTLLAVLFAEWLRWFVDRPLLKVGGRVGRITGEGWAHAGGSASPEVLFFEASNPHSKPVTVSTFGLDYRKGVQTTIHVPQQLPGEYPYQIEGGKALTEWTALDSVFANLRKQGARPSDIKHVWFRSSSGKTYRGKVLAAELVRLDEMFAAGGGEPTESAYQL